MAMDASRWRRIDELFAAALEQPPPLREAFLAEACGDDVELRREVDSLLAHHRDDDFLDQSAAEQAARVMAAGSDEELVGRYLGRFEVLAKLGAGGMGDVYLSNDPKLERRVALKLMPRHLASDPEHVRRFRREALAVSALNHPNILTVHEVLEVDGREVLVSELIEGVTLRERLRRGPLPVPAALDVAAQVARGLAAAHGVGIVHRDVKPENLMLRADGLVKLLDFGIAKSPPPRGEGRDLSQSPTHVLTAIGKTMGTASYMSPEQARGEPAGAQADVWALGCVLYEALTGRQAFPGQAVTDVFDAILTREPDWVELPAETPFLARSLLRRCLQKNPDQRLHDVADARLELEEAAREPLVATTPSTGRRAHRWLPWTAAVLATAAALAIATMTLRQPAAAPPVAVRFELPHPTGGRYYHSVESSNLALSPDGALLGFITLGLAGPSTSIWIRPLTELAARPVPGTEGATSLFWSPDGQSLGFVAAGKLKRVGVAGGTPVVLCDVEEGAGVNGTWGRDWILFDSLQSNVLRRVPADGGAPSDALRADASRGERLVRWPWYLPDGERFLYLAYKEDGTSELRLAGPRGEPRTVAPLASRVEFVDPGFVVFAREGALMAQRFHAERAVLEGTPLPLAPAVRAFGSTGAAAFATSRRGTLAMAAQNDLHRLTLFAPDGRLVGPVGEAATAVSIAASPDGRRAIVDRLRPGILTYDLWMVDLERRVETRLTEGPGTEVFARWLPGGRSIVYSATRGIVPNLLRRDLASGIDEELVPPGPFQIAVAATPDGHRLLYRQRTPSGGFELMVVPLDRSGSPVPVLRSGVFVSEAALSPDGRLLAYVSREAGRPELFVRLLAGGESVRVSTDGAWTARFAPDGETLFYTTYDRQLAAVPVAAAPELAVGAPMVRFALPALGWADFAILRDGRFLALVREADSTTAPLTVMTGWNAPS